MFLTYLKNAKQGIQDHSSLQKLFRLSRVLGPSFVQSPLQLNSQVLSRVQVQGTDIAMAEVRPSAQLTIFVMIWTNALNHCTDFSLLALQMKISVGGMSLDVIL